ncbi:MAG TPA: flagellar hook capping FlgD N-terminal domain-containing protein [Turneriella sp.]|nr:flagellar hook capping FlgD N-terminal domain-containing protein [Turneriella sp.]
MPDINNVQTQDADVTRLREFQRSRQRQPVSHNGKTPLVRKSGYDALDKNSFLKLLVTQLSKQDPTNPMNDREFISQMAQFSSLEQMNNVASSMNKLRNAQANTLIGKMVEGKDFVTEKHLQGIVTAAIYEPNGDVLLKVGGRFTKFDDITSVTEVSPSSANIPNGQRPSPLSNGAESGMSRQPVPNVSRETSITPIKTSTSEVAKAYEENQTQKVVSPSTVEATRKVSKGEQEK